MNTTTGNPTAQSEAVEIGAMIREAREAFGYELRDVAAQLRIRIAHLEAIEAGRLSDLPGNTYVSGFLRAYAGQLGLDGDEILQRLKTSGMNIGKQPPLELLSPVEEGRLPTRPIFLLAVVIALAAYGGWYYLSSHEEGSGNGVGDQGISGNFRSDDARSGLSGSPTGAFPALAPGASQGDSPPSFTGSGDGQTAETAPILQSSPTQRPVAAGTGLAGTESTPPPRLPAETSRPAASRQAAPMSDSHGPSDRTVAPGRAEAIETGGVAEETSGAAPPEGTAETRALPPAPPPDSARPQASAVEVSAPPNGDGEAVRPARIVVRAIADSFILVRDEDDNELYSGMLQAGDTYQVPPSENLLLDTGNAGGLRLIVDGEEAPLLGSAGDVLRGISLDRASLFDR